jgi:hypothetical protein
LNWSFGTGSLRLIGIDSSALRWTLALLLAAGLGAFLFSKLRRREWMVLIYPAWFVIVLSPLLPLRFHMEFEYLTVPTIGLALWGGAALVAGWSAGGGKRPTALLVAAIYIVVSIPIGRAIAASFHERSIRIRNLFESVESLTREQPHRTVFFKGVSEEIFNDVLYHRAFQLIGINDVYVLSENLAKLREGFLPGGSEAFFLDPAAERRGLVLNRAVVYDLAGGTVTDVTAQYKSSLLSSTLDLGDDSSAAQLGSTWYPREGGYRWMPKQATVTLPGPSTASEKLYVKGFCPGAAVRNGPVKISILAAGQLLRAATISQPDAGFELSFELPAQLAGRLAGQPAVVFQLELDKTFRVPGDARELGLIVSSIGIR